MPEPAGVRMPTSSYFSQRPSPWSWARPGAHVPVQCAGHAESSRGSSSPRLRVVCCCCSWPRKRVRGLTRVRGLPRGLTRRPRSGTFRQFNRINQISCRRMYQSQAERYGCKHTHVQAHLHGQIQAHLHGQWGPHLNSCARPRRDTAWLNAACRQWHAVGATRGGGYSHPGWMSERPQSPSSDRG